VKNVIKLGFFASQKATQTNWLRIKSRKSTSLIKVKRGWERKIEWESERFVRLLVTRRFTRNHLQPPVCSLADDEVSPLIGRCRCGNKTLVGWLGLTAVNPFPQGASDRCNDEKSSMLSIGVTRDSPNKTLGFMFCLGKTFAFNFGRGSLKTSPKRLNGAH
jgi:hypothetical protein